MTMPDANEIYGDYKRRNNLLNSHGQPADKPGSRAELADKIGYVGEVLNELRNELERAIIKHAAGTTPHHCLGTIEEEVHELREHVYRDTGRTPEARKEAIQIAAMAVRYIVDLIDARK